MLFQQLLYLMNTYSTPTQQNILEKKCGFQRTYLTIMLLCKVFPVHIALRNGIIRIDTESSVSDLNWQTIFKIQKTNLANIFQLTASLANFRLLISCITSWPPPENCEWPCAYLALLVIISFCLQRNQKITYDHERQKSDYIHYIRIIHIIHRFYQIISTEYEDLKNKIQVTDENNDIKIN